VIARVLNPNTGEMEEIGRTELIRDTQEPDFRKHITAEKLSKLERKVHFGVYNSPKKGAKLLGETTVSLSELKQPFDEERKLTIKGKGVDGDAVILLKSLTPEDLKDKFEKWKPTSHMVFKVEAR